MPSNSTYTILDGGMGTTLEDTGHNVSSHLWSSDPSLVQAVQQVHRGFCEAGAEIIGTATYQASESLYTASGEISPEKARELMVQQVQVASETISSTAEGSRKQVGLSLGPYGATLQPGAEYSGIYPSPYGPLTPSTTFPNSSGLDESITSLVDFHLDRLLTYAKDVSTWQSISWICFETIPLIREGIAIRLALKELDAYLEGKGMERKKVWISFVFPNGVFPDGTTIPEIVSTILSPEISSTKGTAKQLLPVPSAIGLNCTSPHYIDRLTREFTSACQSFQREHDSESSVGFVIYPDGGLVYDTVTRTWSTPSHNSSDGAGKGGSWAENVAAVAKIAGEATKEDGKKVWGGGVLVGGCCKSGYEEIKGLKLCLDRA